MIQKETDRLERYTMDNLPQRMLVQQSDKLHRRGALS
jgi:hypothetical protein